jgi:hypothetical protein
MSIHLSVHPKVPQDLSLAPVAVTIDLNLQILRDLEPHEILVMFEFELDRPERSPSTEERASRVLMQALRNVDLHGWKAEITADHDRLRLTGGSVSLDLGLSTSILRFIEGE